MFFVNIENLILLFFWIVKVVVLFFLILDYKFFKGMDFVSLIYFKLIIIFL